MQWTDNGGEMKMLRRRLHTAGKFVVATYSFIVLYLIITTLRERRDINRAHPILVDGMSDVPLMLSRPPACERERVNIVFVKTHKCATTTTVHMLLLFCLRRNLTFVLPHPYHHTLCYPHHLEPRCHRPPKTTPFNIMCQHVVYNEDVMTQIMPPDTVYVTSIREPFARMKSAFYYYRVYRRALIPTKPNEPLIEYLRDIPKYEAMYTSTDNHKYYTKAECMRSLSLTHNHMAFDLGLPNGFHVDTPDQTKNATYIRRWIDALQRRLSLVMIVEYYNESLVLLRRLMCWKLPDLLYIRTNINKHNDAKAEHIDQSLVDNFKQYNKPEYMLYNHFNRTLWRRIAEQPDDFWDELNEFERLLKEKTEFCQQAKDGDVLSFQSSKWNDEFVLTVAECGHMKSGAYMDLVRNYNQNPAKVATDTNEVPGC